MILTRSYGLKDECIRQGNCVGRLQCNGFAVALTGWGCGTRGFEGIPACGGPPEHINEARSVGRTTDKRGLWPREEPNYGAPAGPCGEGSDEQLPGSGRKEESY